MADEKIPLAHGTLVQHPVHGKGQFLGFARGEGGQFDPQKGLFLKDGDSDPAKAVVVDYSSLSPVPAAGATAARDPKDPASNAPATTDEVSTPPPTPPPPVAPPQE